MRKNYQIESYFDFLGYEPARREYFCEDLLSVNAYLRGDAAQLEELLKPTPFELADDRFIVNVADFTKKAGHQYFDAAVILQVKYGTSRGGMYYFEYEDHHGSVHAGRELWGYPKMYAEIAGTETTTGFEAAVSMAGSTILELAFEENEAVDSSTWADVSAYPHLQVRAVPELSGRSFDSFDVLSRNTSLDYQLKKKTIGSAVVKFGRPIDVNGEPLVIVETLGAEMSVGDYASTLENGLPTILGSLASGQR